MHKIHDVNPASTHTRFQEDQGQDFSNNHGHIQNEQQQCLQSTDYYQDANNIIGNNQSNDRELGRKAVNNQIPETYHNLCNFNLNAQDQDYQITTTELTNNQVDGFYKHR